jgi:replicative DNA helicase
MIDYLQILKPADPRASDKQNTDWAVSELKRISREHKIPVLAISSLNRENYHMPINLTSFKESGAIEYSSDVLIGLQVEGPTPTATPPKAKTIRTPSAKSSRPRARSS